MLFKPINIINFFLNNAIKNKKKFKIDIDHVSYQQCILQTYKFILINSNEKKT